MAVHARVQVYECASVRVCKCAIVRVRVQVCECVCVQGGGVGGGRDAMECVCESL